MAEKNLIERVPTGIPGLDGLIEGGFVKGSTNIVLGDYGAGKSIFGAQFLYQGIKEFGEPGVMVTLEQPVESVIRDASRVGMDLQKLIDDNKLIVEYIEPYTVHDEMWDIFSNAVRKIKAKRFLLDSTSVIGIQFKYENEIRRNIFDMIQQMRRLECTTLLTSELGTQQVRGGRFREEYIVDGVVVLRHNMGQDEIEFKRTLEIPKMRSTNPNDNVHRLEITDKGIKVIPTRA